MFMVACLLVPAVTTCMCCVRQHAWGKVIDWQESVKKKTAISHHLIEEFPNVGFMNPVCSYKP